jgi:hypothetical protein
VQLKTDLRFHDACADPSPNPITSRDFAKIAIKQAGTFSGRHVVAAHGAQDGTRTTIRGRFVSRKKAAGALRLQVITGSGVKRCDTGRVGFTAILK